MLEIHQMYGDNLGYIVYGEGEAMVVDPAPSGDEEGFLQDKGLSLKCIVNTHSHYDHTGGNERLASLTGAPIIGFEELLSTGKLQISNCEINVIHTPGHTRDSVCFFFNGQMITGDTIFIANVGNCGSGLLNDFKRSLDLIIAYPENTVIWPGHDYTERSVKRAMGIEKSNEEISQFWNSYDPPPVKSTIGTEKGISPYLRVDQPEIVKHLEAKGMPAGTSMERFSSFLELY